MNILRNKLIISDKDTFKIKGTTPIYKQDICNMIQGFQLLQWHVSKVHFSNERDIPCKSLE